MNWLGFYSLEIWTKILHGNVHLSTYTENAFKRGQRDVENSMMNTIFIQFLRETPPGTLQ